MRPLTPVRSLFRCRVLATSLTAALAATTFPAGATIDTSNNAELALTIWDPIAQASYTRDLGINIADFFNYAQSDNGYQQFWRIDSTDLAFAQLRSLGTASSSTYWQVTADDGSGSPSAPGEINFYTTLTQGTANGVLNPTYDTLVNKTAADVIGGGLAASSYQLFLVGVNNAPIAAYNTQRGNVGVNGSSFSLKGQNGYVGTDESWQISTGFFGGDPTRGIINKVGNSSWFYKLYLGGIDDSDPVSVDEFDNLGHDGYWGLAVDPATGDYVLSYTLQGATINSMAVTASGLARVSVTEYRAAIGTAHFMTTPTIEFVDYAGLSMTSAVPEPSSWALSLAGLAAIGWVARKRRG